MQALCNEASLVCKRVHVRMCVRVQVRVQVRLSLGQRVRDISAFMCIHGEAGIVHGTTRQPQPPPVRGRRRGVEGQGRRKVPATEVSSEAR